MSNIDVTDQSAIAFTVSVTSAKTVVTYNTQDFTSITDTISVSSRITEVTYSVPASIVVGMITYNIAADTNRQAWSQSNQTLKYTETVPPPGESDFSFSVTATPVGSPALQPSSAIAIIRKQGGL